MLHQGAFSKQSLNRFVAKIL